MCLVTKLQVGLSTAVPKIERRLSSETGRFSKRKNRQSRHTVGVSSEELADARRLIEEISGHKITPSTSKTDSINIQKRNSESNDSSNTAILSKKESDELNHLSKQNSDSSVTSNPSINKYINKSLVKNTTPKPFSSSNNSSTVPTPDISEHLDAFFEDEIQKMSSQDKHLDELVNKSHQPTGIINTVLNGSEPEEDTIKVTDIVEEPKLSVNPIYSKPENSYNQFDSKHMDRFNTQIKKQRMKRANTIDIPKPLQFYEDSDCSDGETEEQKHKNNYYALRGPIRVGDPVIKKTVPTFQPKTASDQKFLAFLNKNTDNSDDKNKNSIWTDHKNRASVWGSKFGNIKNNFESSGRPQSNNVKNFWKTQDDALTARSNQYGPKISRQSARNLQQMFEDKQREKDILPERLKPLKNITEEHNALTGKLTIKTEPEKNYRFLPGPLPVNQFSHAPQSAFKPIPKKSHTFKPIIQEPNKENVLLPESPQELLKTEIKDNNKSLFLYSPKPLTNSQGTSPALSPISTKPWLTPSPEGGSRVLNMAAKKFEVPQQQIETQVIKPRKLSKELTSAFVPKQQPTEKLVPSYITKTSDAKNSTVRKLSDQYDTIGSKTPEYTSHTSVVYQPSTPLKMPEVYSEKVSTNDSNRPKFTPTSPREPKPTPWWHQAYRDKVSGQRSTSNQQKSFDNEKKINQFQSPNNNYNSTTALYNTQEIYQHVPGKESNPTSPENIYTSTLTFSPTGKPKNQQLEAVSHPPKLETQLSNESIHEYTAISSKVMGSAQQAVTVKQGPMTRNEHDMAAVFNLKNTLSTLGKTADDRIQPKINSVSPIKPSSTPEVTQKISVPDPIRKFSPQNTVSAQGGYYKAPEPQNNDYNISQRSPQKSPQRLSSRSFGSKDVKPNSNDPKLGVVKPMQKTMAPVYNNVARIQTAAAQSQQTVEFNEKGQGVVTSKFHIPVVSVEPGSPLPSNIGGRALSKSDSWHQICLASNQTANKPTPGRNVVKSKSSHSLAVPQRQFEAGMSKDELLQKRKAMESYLLGGNKSPQTVSPTKSEKVVKTSINRIKTSEKHSAYKSSGISRSRTLPDIVCPPLLDESNVDQAFEDLFKSSCI